VGREWLEHSTCGSRMTIFYGVLYFPPALARQYPPVPVTF
jgi:hypothetical protein